MNFVSFDLHFRSVSCMESSCWCYFHNKHSTCTPTLSIYLKQMPGHIFALFLLLLFKNLGIYLFAHSRAVYLNMCSMFRFFLLLSRSHPRCNRFTVDSMRLCRKRVIRFIFTSQNIFSNTRKNAMPSISSCAFPHIRSLPTSDPPHLLLQSGLFCVPHRVCFTFII